MKLKVCGMHHNVQAVAGIKPDYLGFIFYETSARNFTHQHINVDPSIKRVGVFVDETANTILEKIKQFDLQLIQLHGSESPELCRELKDVGVEVIKVFSIKDAFDFSRLVPYEAFVDYFLFDTKGKLPGGNGFAFDWTVLNGYPSKVPYFLSGGIGLDQADELAEFLNSESAELCHAIDVNSQFEIEPGLKEIERLQLFKSKL